MANSRICVCCVVSLLVFLCFTVRATADPPGSEFVFKTVPTRDLMIYVDYAPDWTEGDARPAIVFWHGGGFKSGTASQFSAQAEYFAQRGMVCFRPEYRVEEVDGAMPHHAMEDAISAMRWVRERAGMFGIDPDRIASGGGSAGGHLAAAVWTTDQDYMAAEGYVGAGDNQAVSPKPNAMILFNPFLDFFAPTNARQFEAEMIRYGQDPAEFEDLYHVMSPIEHMSADMPPCITQFGSKDAFYPHQLQWIINSKQLGVRIDYYVYKGEVHSWFNNSPHIEYTTEYVDTFLQSMGWLGAAPEVELPHKQISPEREAIQNEKYATKLDWDDYEAYRERALAMGWDPDINYHQLAVDNGIELIPFGFYEDPVGVNTLLIPWFATSDRQRSTG
jgi:acetyl esterase/lipase